MKSIAASRFSTRAGAPDARDAASRFLFSAAQTKEADVIEFLPMDAAPKDGSWILLRMSHPGAFLAESGYVVAFWGTDGCWYAGESDSHSVTAFGDEPIGWATLPKINAR